LFTVLAAFFVGSKLYGNKGGIITSLLVALSPVTWGSISNTIGVNVEPLVFLGLFYFLIKFLRGDKISFVFAAFFAGLTLQFETALPLVLIPMMIIITFTNRQFIKNWRLIILSFFAYALSVSSFILFDLRHQFLMTKALIGTFLSGQHGKGYLVLKDRIPDHLSSLLGVYKDVLFSQDFLLLIIFVAILLLAVYLFIKQKDKYKKEFFFLLGFPLLAYLFFMFYPYAVWPEYVLGLLAPVVLAFYLATIKVWGNTVGKVLVGLFFMLTFLGVFSQLQSQYLKPYPKSTSDGSYLNQKAVIEWVYKDAGKGTFGYFVYTPEIYTQGTDYLISWYGKKHPSVVFETQKDKITYLILYPHMANDEGAYTFWKKNVIRTKGKVLMTKTFGEGITVEKLSINGNEPAVDPNYYQGLLFR
jgi:hypothetical protein